MRRNACALSWICVLATPLAAQHRAPFTGVVRDPNGTAMPGTAVVCTWSPDGSSLAPAERHDTTTDADGRFAVDLAVGRAYCVWAIGPAGADSRRRVVAPTFRAVGGRTLDLVADRSMAPVQLQVTGASAWRPAGPLALRIVVASGAALPDFVIAGDGVVTLPPLPTNQLTVCLLDFRRDVLDSVQVDADALTPCAFAPVTAATFVVVDADDKPVAGASIVGLGGFQHRQRPRFVEHVGFVRSRREVAVTGADGKAGGLVRAKTHASLIACHEGAWSRVAGTFGDQRVENGKPVAAEGDEPFHFRLELQPPRNVQLAGAGDDVVMHCLVRSLISFRLRNGGGGLSWETPLTREGDLWTGSAPGILFAWSLGEGAGARPLRVAAWTQDQHIDLTTLRRLDVKVVGADGRPAPFAVVGISHDLRGFPVYWTTHLVTDADGRAELRVMPGECELYAVTAEAHGYTAIPDGASTEATISLQSLATMRVRVVDDSGIPVAGARVDLQGGQIPNHGIGRVADVTFHDPFGGLLSDANGIVVARLPREIEGVHTCTAHWRGNSSARATVELDREQPIELRLPR